MTRNPPDRIARTQHIVAFYPNVLVTVPPPVTGIPEIS
jgi:hypothetical protein